jgi:hypothetical protein
VAGRQHRTRQRFEVGDSSAEVQAQAAFESRWYRVEVPSWGLRGRLRHHRARGARNSMGRKSKSDAWWPQKLQVAIMAESFLCRIVWFDCLRPAHSVFVFALRFRPVVPIKSLFAGRGWPECGSEGRIRRSGESPSPCRARLLISSFWERSDRKNICWSRAGD